MVTHSSPLAPEVTTRGDSAWHDGQVSEAWKREIAAIHDKVRALDAKAEELLAAGPIAPGIIEAAAALAHDAAQLEARLNKRLQSS